jgi:hypothetical protein
VQGAGFVAHRVLSKCMLQPACMISSKCTARNDMIFDTTGESRAVASGYPPDMCTNGTYDKQFIGKTHEAAAGGKK